MHLLKIKAVVEGLDKISYAKEGDAALDLRASGNWTINLDFAKKEICQDSYELQPKERILIKTGIKVALPKGHFGHIQGRSGLALKHGLQPIGGVIDENYRDEIGVILVNLGQNPYKITKNEKIAQMIIKEYKRVNVEYVEELDETNRQEGFGSSGKY